MFLFGFLTTALLSFPSHTTISSSKNNDRRKQYQHQYVAGSDTTATTMMTMTNIDTDTNRMAGGDISQTYDNEEGGTIEKKEQEKETHTANIDINSVLDYQEIKWGNKLLVLESELRSSSSFSGSDNLNKKGEIKLITLKRRKKLENKARNLREKLAKHDGKRLGSSTIIIEKILASILNNENIDNEKENDEVKCITIEINAELSSLGQEEEHIKENQITEIRRRWDLLIKAQKQSLPSVSSPPKEEQQKQKTVNQKEDENTVVKKVDEVAIKTENNDRVVLEKNDLKSEETSSSLSLVVVSDTHGFEHDLTTNNNNGDEGETKSDSDDNDNESGVLPMGDVLLHLGDFSIDGPSGPRDEALIGFDRWLAKQPHKTKIVIRGNHDPWLCNFELSGATFVTEICTMNIGGVAFSLMPYCSSRQIMQSISKIQNGDVLVSHVPPYRVLDKCLTSEHAGSVALSRSVKKMSKPPLLWLCGHIHEGRGVLKTNISQPSLSKHSDGRNPKNHVSKKARKKKRAQSQHNHHPQKKNNHNNQDNNIHSQETVVINAANANAGKATHIEHGPIVVTIDAKNKNVQIVQMEGGCGGHQQDGSSSIESANGFYSLDDTDGEDDEVDNDKQEGSSNNRMVIAVDLGATKNGISLFNNYGKLIRYEQVHFTGSDAKQLQQQITQLIQAWEKEANDILLCHDGDNSSDRTTATSSSISTSLTSNGIDDKSSVPTALLSPPSKEERWKVSHIAVMGGDAVLFNAWNQAVVTVNNNSSQGDKLHVEKEGKEEQEQQARKNRNTNKKITWASQGEWRSELLLPKESKSSNDAKVATNLIARQIVGDCSSDSTMAVKGKLQSNISRSIVLGWYTARKLGWLTTEQRTPAIIRRYTNGKIIVPNKKK